MDFLFLRIETVPITTYTRKTKRISAHAPPWLEGHWLEFRAARFNVLNRVNLKNPIATRNNSLFGQITTAGNPRILQLGLRYAF